MKTILKIIFSAIVCACFMIASQKALSQEAYYLGFKENDFKHFSACYMISFAGNGIVYELTKSKTAGAFGGLALGMIAGTAKEYNDRKKGGIFSKQDLKADLIGSLCGTITLRLILWNSIHRKKVPIEYRYLVDN